MDDSLVEMVYFDSMFVGIGGWRDGGGGGSGGMFEVCCVGV